MSNSISDTVYSYTFSKIKYLESIRDTSAGKAMLANMRRGIGKQPGELPELWGIVFEDIPDELTGKSGPSDAEQSVYISLTLYALHCQGSETSMNASDVSLGKAAAGLVHTQDDKERIEKRLNLVVSSNSLTDIAYQLRGIVYLLKNDGIALDYPRLAKELYLFAFPAYSGEVKLKWGRDFYRELSKNTKGEENNE
jgi:CRISPR system Cascade subunit CasB